jgi:hypothetical protein
MARPDIVRLEAIHLDVALITDDEAAAAVEHHEALGHVGDGGVEAQVLRLQIRLPRPQFLGTLDHEPLEVALDSIDLLDHQGHRSVGAPAVAVVLFIGAADEFSEALQVG